jgi:hypothetical protein
MPPKLLIPKPMVAIELCATCGRQHVDPRSYRRCSVCRAVFCWQGRPRGENFFGVERRACGSRGAASSRAHGGAWGEEPLASRRVQSDIEEPARRLEYRCRRHGGPSWVVFGADWAAIRPIAIYLFLCVTFSVAFWGLVFLLVSAWLRQLGVG